MNQQVHDFFLHYERANASSDDSAIGALYADTFMFGGPNGVQLVKKEDFLKFIPKMKAHLRSLGLVETQLDTVQTDTISSEYLLAKTRWKMKLRNPGADTCIDAFASYVLFGGQAGVLSIVFQVDHQDLATVIRTSEPVPERKNF